MDTAYLESRKLEAEQVRTDHNISDNIAGCEFCNYPCSLTTMHNVPITNDTFVSVGVLCDDCYKKATVDERIEVYTAYVMDNVTEDDYPDCAEVAYNYILNEDI
jgi:hypothetical protein